MKKIFQLSIIITIGILLTSCSAAPYNAAEVPANSRSRNQWDIDSDKIKKAEETERKIIYNASMRIEVDEIDNQTKDVIAKAKAQGGYMVSSDIDNVSLRIPAEKLTSFMDEIGTMGEVDSRNVYSQDVTEAYADMEIRLENAEKTRKRYLELLNKAEKVSDILEIERELERLNNEIERLKGQRKSYDTQVQYSSVNIYFFTKAKPGPLGYIFVGLYKGVKFLFVRD
ncbi:MAG: DUF4349 domain-containing protein [Saprospiraceae bacterium]